MKKIKRYALIALNTLFLIFLLQFLMWLTKLPTTASLDTFLHRHSPGRYIHTILKPKEPDKEYIPSGKPDIPNPKKLRMPAREDRC